MTLVHLQLKKKPNPQNFHPASKTVCTFPGKLGDNLARLPVVRALEGCRESTVDIAVDMLTAPSFMPLVASLPWVGKVFPLTGVMHYGCGGQPINFDEPQDEWFHAAGYEIVHHLGYRRYPTGNLTHESAAGVGESREDLERYGRYPLGLGFDGTVKRILVAPESSREYAGRSVVDTFAAQESLRPPGERPELPFWFLGDAHKYCTGVFKTGGGVAASVFNWTRVSDELTGLLGVAHLLCDSLVITTYSAISQLAALVECPCIVLIPPQGINLGHYDSRTPWYPLWRVVTEGDANGLKAAIDELLTLISESRKEQEP